ncbi:MAG: hypothetical protein ACXVNF_00150 [Neobacillus sp.]
MEYCQRSHLRDEGIKRTSTPGVYFADADLQCTGECTGHDQDIIYELSLFRWSGDARILGNPVKVGNDRVEVVGTGTFYLNVKVAFRCRGFFGRIF